MVRENMMEGKTGDRSTPLTRITNAGRDLNQDAQICRVDNIRRRRSPVATRLPEQSAKALRESGHQPPVPTHDNYGVPRECPF